ncbi:MAG: Rne/Rng family ribonuclease [Acidobacteriota bacterium]
MTRRMLINAQKPEELRIAITNGAELEDFQIESTEQGMTRGNIYRAVVANVQPSLNAAFVDYGAERHGFLSIQDVVPQAAHHPGAGSRKTRIDKLLDRGKEIIVQVNKDPEGQKGAGLTTNLSLAGRYLVFTPFDDTRGVSRKVEDDELRQKLKEQVAKLNVPDGGGFIVRTNAIDQTQASLKRDFSALMRFWKQIEKDAGSGKGPKLLYGDQDLVIKSLRDYFDTSIEEVLIDDAAAFERAEAYARSFMPRGKATITLYSDRVPLFSKFGLDTSIEQIYQRTVTLPSGGSIVIDRTEALVAIDVNSGRARASSQEDTALKTNLEAATEVARQLRLRDIGGLIVVDFIDMRGAKNDAAVERTLRDAMKPDKARSSVGRISDNGLLEINRQRIRQALSLRTHRACPTCEGTGRIASPEMVGLNLLRRIEAQASTRPIRKVRIELHPELADAFQNTRRREIAALEQEFDLNIEVIASSSLHRPEQEIEWFVRPDTQPKSVPELQQSKPSAANGAEPIAIDGKRPRKRRRRKHKGDHPPDQHSQIHEEMPRVDSAGTITEETAWVWLSDDASDHDAQMELETDPGAEAGATVESPFELAPEHVSLPHSGEAPASGEVRKGRKRRRRKKKPAQPGTAAAALADEAAPAEPSGDQPEDLDEDSVLELTPEPIDGEPHSEDADGPDAAAGPVRRPRRRYRRRGRRPATATTESPEPPSEGS